MARKTKCVSEKKFKKKRFKHEVGIPCLLTSRTNNMERLNRVRYESSDNIGNRVI